jgi:2-polyprenyl-3-methyl-5-hydroxy-6-metoxy-1,4-benzoquinol methylase
MSSIMNEYDDISTLYDSYFTGVEGDVHFYLAEALNNNRGSVLELGCGNGRITIPLAEAGLRVTGLDISEKMLGLARAKTLTLDDPIRRRIRLEQADMRDFQLNRRFSTIMAPYRTFMHLLTPQDQVQALVNIRAHLSRHGRLLLNVFDPTEELAAHHTPDATLHYDMEFQHPQSGHRIIAWYTRRYDIVQQVIHQQMIFDELDDAGNMIQRTYHPLTLRYSHRYELHYLLELCGYEVEALYGGFSYEPYQGGEQVWVAKLSDSD